ncbi:hypothetical protein AVO51_18460 [Vibrio cholerae]|nr:hypothetical protein AVO51_18460 [Vibrio cholerae]
MVEESKSKRNFKAELIKKLPFFPDDRNTLQQLESEGLGNVMFYYLHWSTRQVPSRVRKVHIYPELTADKRYKMLKEQIKLFRYKVSNGEDLSPYLSLKLIRKDIRQDKESLMVRRIHGKTKIKFLIPKAFTISI